MPRGENPNSIKNLALAYGGKGGFTTETARRAVEKKTELNAVFKSINEDLRERCTPELIAAINERLISLALNGNIKAYEMIRNGLGEDPAKKYNLMGSGKVEYVLNWGNGPEDYSETGYEVMETDTSSK